MIAAKPDNVTCCTGRSASFTVGASGTGPITYQWLKNNAVITGETNATYTINSVSSINEGTYKVKVTNPCGTDTSSQAILTVNSGLTITAQPANISACIGSTARFSVTASGARSYQWQRFVGTSWNNLAVGPLWQHLMQVSTEF